MWLGSGDTFISLQPSQVEGSSADGVDEDAQVGTTSHRVFGVLYPHAALWYGDASSWVDLHPPGARRSMAVAVHDGQQVGSAFFEDDLRIQHAILWTGSAASWVDLTPDGGQFGGAAAFGVHSGEQVGETYNTPYGHACLWRGTPESIVDLNPDGMESSGASACYSGCQVGYTHRLFQDPPHAAIWFGSPSTWFDLHSVLPEYYSESTALGVSAENGVVVVVGYGYNTTTYQYDALRWTSDADSDGDGLYDDWEINGIPYTLEDGTQARYCLPHADPLHKNLYVEVDVMRTLDFPQAAAEAVQQAFCNAPLECPTPNPDGLPGIILDLDARVEDEFGFEEISLIDQEGHTGFPVHAATWKGQFFGTPLERSMPSARTLLQAKAQAYRYCLVINAVASNRYFGRAEINGTDTVLCVHNRTPEQIAAVFMHELGHNLGLRHGGSDDINWKPNYPSVMNYSLTERQPWSCAFWHLDYCRVQLPSMDENSLDEFAAYGHYRYSSYRMPFRGIVSALALCYSIGDWGQPHLAYVSLTPGRRTDFNLNCTVRDRHVTADVNYLNGLLFSDHSSSSPNQVLVGSNDWSHIALPPRSKPTGFLGYSPVELTVEQTERLALLPPPPPECVADFNCDGFVNAADYDDFVQLFEEGEPITDINGDGFIDFFDYDDFVQRFDEGCE